jgi:hypothetical protein
MVVASLAHAETVVLSAAKDNSIYEDVMTNSNGIGENIFTGNNAIGFARRAFIAFDVAGTIPAGATVDSVVLQLSMSRTPLAAGPQPVALHRVLADWGEGQSDAIGNEGGGAMAMAGDVTWTYRFYNTDTWATLGGEFVPSQSAVLSVDSIGIYTWQSSGMRDDVQGWLDAPATNFGWVLVGNEGQIQTTKRFASDEDLVPANRPMLTIYYTEAPTAIGDRAPSLGARLLPATPNPSTHDTALGFDLDAPQHVTLTIYDARGREVRRIASGDFARGTHDARWNATDAAGSRVGSGVYFVRLEIDGRTIDAQRVVLLR